MSKLNKIVGITKKEFDELVTAKKMFVREARLIPFSKPGDEISLASVLLSSIKLIKEFRQTILTVLKMPTTGKMHIYSEVCFGDSKDRPDGLILIEKGGIIVDAALLELKTNDNEIPLEQIERYTSLAKELNVSRIITISNQYVSDPSQNPLHLRNTKNFSYFHFSWTYLLTVGHILLTAKDTGIHDEDQKEIMKEVLCYLEAEKSGVCGFNQMKKGWTNVVDNIHSGIQLKQDENTKEAVLSWQQEEMDIALMLSKKLGVIINSGENKYKTDLEKRLDDESKQLISQYTLNSTFRIKGAVSPITVCAYFQKRAIEMSIRLRAPLDKKSKGQMSWLEKQLKNCKSKKEAKFNEIHEGLRIDIYFKNVSKPERLRYLDFVDSLDSFKDKEIRDFDVMFYKDLSKDFGSRKKFVENIEAMISDFYNTIVEHMRNYELVAPKMIEGVPAIDATIPVEPIKTEDIDSISADCYEAENVEEEPAA